MAPDARRKLEQIRLSKQKKAITKVNDLRQLIKKNSPNTNLHRSPDRAIRKGPINRLGPNSNGSRDLRDTNLRRIPTRGNPSPTNRAYQPLSRNVQTMQNPRSSDIVKRPFSSYTGQLRSDKRYPEMQHYVPPHVQRNQQAAGYMTTPAVNKLKPAIHSNRSDTQGASILVSNLPTSISQSDIIQIFCEMGNITSVNLINPTTALVTFQNANDAVRAVKINHSRLLDDKPMIVNMMPTTV